MRLSKILTVIIFEIIVIYGGYYEIFSNSLSVGKQHGALHVATSDETVNNGRKARPPEARLQSSLAQYKSTNLDLFSAGNPKMVGTENIGDDMETDGVVVERQEIPAEVERQREENGFRFTIRKRGVGDRSPGQPQERQSRYRGPKGAGKGQNQQAVNEKATEAVFASVSGGLRYTGPRPSLQEEGTGLEEFMKAEETQQQPDPSGEDSIDRLIRYACDNILDERQGLYQHAKGGELELPYGTATIEKGRIITYFTAGVTEGGEVHPHWRVKRAGYSVSIGPIEADKEQTAQLIAGTKELMEELFPGGVHTLITEGEHRPDIDWVGGKARNIDMAFTTEKAAAAYLVTTYARIPVPCIPVGIDFFPRGTIAFPRTRLYDPNREYVRQSIRDHTQILAVSESFVGKELDELSVPLLVFHINNPDKVFTVAKGGPRDTQQEVLNRNSICVTLTDRQAADRFRSQAEGYFQNIGKVYTERVETDRSALSRIRDHECVLIDREGHIQREEDKDALVEQVEKHLQTARGVSGKQLQPHPTTRVNPGSRDGQPRTWVRDTRGGHYVIALEPEAYDWLAEEGIQSIEVYLPGTGDRTAVNRIRLEVGQYSKAGNRHKHSEGQQYNPKPVNLETSFAKAAQTAAKAASEEVAAAGRARERELNEKIASMEQSVRDLVTTCDRGLKDTTEAALETTKVVKEHKTLFDNYTVAWTHQTEALLANSRQLTSILQGFAVNAGIALHPGPPQIQHTTQQPLPNPNPQYPQPYQQLPAPPIQQQQYGGSGRDPRQGQQEQGEDPAAKRQREDPKVLVAEAELRLARLKAEAQGERDSKRNGSHGVQGNHIDEGREA
eukprot:gene2009-2695_t